MAGVTFSSDIGGDDITITDDADPNTGLANGGHRTRFIIALQQLVKVAAFTVQAGLSAIGGDTNVGTSSGTATLGLGDKTFPTQAGKPWFPGQRLCAAVSSTQAMYGVVKSYSGTTLVITVDEFVGAGSPAGGWVIGPSAGSGTGVPTSRTITGGGLVTGGGDLSANRTLTVTAAGAAEYRAMTDNTKAFTAAGVAAGEAEVTLGYSGANIVTSGDAAPDMADFTNAVITLTQNSTLPNPTNAVAGKTGRIRVVVGGSGGYTLGFGSAWDFEETNLPTASTTVGYEDYIDYDVVSSTKIRARYSKRWG